VNVGRIINGYVCTAVGWTAGNQSVLVGRGEVSTGGGGVHREEAFTVGGVHRGGVHRGRGVHRGGGFHRGRCPQGRRCPQGVGVHRKGWCPQVEMSIVGGGVHREEEVSTWALGRTKSPIEWVLG
jgi:hypothetical protein